MKHRTAQEVAKRALAMGAVAFRATLEVTDHPRTREIAKQIPQWLDKLSISDALDPIERNILRTPYGQLDRSQRLDTNWSGEGAALFGWTLRICEKPPQFKAADHSAALTTLKVMRNEAEAILNSAVLRSEEELLDYCKAVRVTRVVLQEIHVLESDLDAGAKDLVISLGRQKVIAELADCGIQIAASDIDETRIIFTDAKPNECQSVSGAYVARDVGVTWLLTSRPRYFDND